VKNDSLQWEEEEHIQTETAMLIGTPAEGVPRRHWRIIVFVGCAILGVVALLGKCGENFHVLGQATDSENKAQTNVLREGWVRMQTGIGNWRPVYVVLNDDGTWLQFKSKENKDGEPMFRMSFSHSLLIDDASTKQNSFGVTTFAGNGRIAPIPVNYVVSTDTDEEMQSWKSAIASISQAVTDEAELLDSGTLAAKSLDDFEMLKVLGKGTNGKQMAAKFKADGKTKIVTLYYSQFMDLAKVPLPKVPGITFAPVWEATLKTNDRSITVESNTEAMFLSDHLHAERVLGEEEVRFYAAELVVYIKACHEVGVRPPGINLESIHLDSDGHIVVRAPMDYLLPQPMGAADMARNVYLSPEFLNDGWTLEASDWYMLGVLLYEMLCGRLPFYNRDKEVLFELILHEDVKFPSRLGSVAKQFLGNLLAKDPTTRLGSGTDGHQSLMNHEFFQAVNWEDAAKRRLQPPFVPESRDSESDGPHFGSLVDVE
jgi:RAC serine/threonine-protein kinase